MRKIIFHIVLIFLVTGILSCQRQEILKDCFCTNSAKIPITVDWSKSGITPKNVSVLFYNKEDGSLALEHRYGHNQNDVHSYIHVPVGDYTIVVFNELRDQIKNVEVRGYENLSTLGFYAKENPDTRRRSVSRLYIHEPGELGVVMVRDFVVTDELIAYTHDEEVAGVTSDTKSVSNMLLNLSAKSKVSWLNIKISIKGLNNARMPALVDLRNIAQGYMAAGDRNSMDAATLQYEMNNRIYNPGSLKDGTISERVALFGTLGDRSSISDHTEMTPIIVDILFMLVDKDKTLVSRSIDITNLITFDNEFSGSITLNIEGNIETPLPDVEHDGDSGFGSELGDWDIIDVPL